MRVTGWGLLTLLFFVGSVALVRDTRYQGQDFEVFWRAGRSLIEGRGLYDVTAGDPMVFKYPPWIAALFAPFALLPLVAAKWTWGVLEVISLYSVVRWVLSWARRPGLVAVVAMGFWGIWAVHALDGQITLPILAWVLWAWSRPVRATWGRSAAWVLLTSKIFSWVAILGDPPALKRARVWAQAVLMVGVLSFPVVLRQPDRRPMELLKRWTVAASSGESAFGGGKVWGRDNQGFPAAWVRGDRQERAPHALGAFAVALLVLGSAWAWASRRLDAPARQAGWLGISAAVHPLAWFHTFVLAFPLVALAVDRSVSSKGNSRRWVSGILAATSVFLVCLATRGVIPGAAGDWFEAISAKSWGVVFALIALLIPRS